MQTFLRLEFFQKSIIFPPESKKRINGWDLCHLVCTNDQDGDTGGVTQRHYLG